MTSHFSLKPKKLDWYILREVASPFAGGVLLFTFIFLMFQILRLAEFFIVHGVALGVLAKMTSLLALSFSPTALPVAFLVAVLVGFGRLSSDGELVAMKAGGMSLLRMSAPVLGLGLVVSAFSLALNLNWVPWGEREFKSTLIKVGNTKVVSSIKEGTFTSGFFDLLIYADKVDTRSNRMKGVFIFDEREPKNPLTIVAREGQIVALKPDSALGAASVLRLKDGNIHRNNADEDSYQKIDFEEYRLFLKIAPGADTSYLKPRMIPYKTLTKRIYESAQADPKKNRELRVELWRRFSTALSPVVFVFLGMGLGTIRTRSVRAGATLAAFVVILIFYGLQTLGTVASQKGLLPPWLAMQLPNLIGSAAAYLGFKSASW